MKYVPHSDADYEEMLQSLGVDSFEGLLTSIPKEIRTKESWDEVGLSEKALLKKYKDLAKKNFNVEDWDSYLGGGVYEHFIPSVVSDLSSKPEFVTSYTQYQPESNQGMLQGLFEYQTQLCRLTSMDVSNASHYDGGTSLVEAVLMAFRKKRGVIAYSTYLNPLYKKLLETTFFQNKEFLLEIRPDTGLVQPKDFEKIDNLSCLLIQTPNYLGFIENQKSNFEAAKKLGATCISSVNPVSLGLLIPPGDLGADIVVGEGQPLGIPLSYGGPYFGFLCAKKEWMRKIPGRLVGQTVDSKGRVGYVLTLQTREQHIRREKAVSNICTNQALCALRSSIHMSYLGEVGFKRMSENCFEKAHVFQEKLCAISGVHLTYSQPFFNEFTLSFEGISAAEVLNELKACQIMGGISTSRDLPHLKNAITIAVTETKEWDDLDRYESIVKGVMSKCYA